MNRREAFGAIGAALAGTVAEGATIKAQDERPNLIVIKMADDIGLDNVDVRDLERLRHMVKTIAQEAGWGDVAVMVMPPGLSATFIREIPEGHVKQAERKKPIWW